jgi:ornithine--oxo-acid transaminase
LNAIAARNPLITLVRGKGLLNAIVIIVTRNQIWRGIFVCDLELRLPISWPHGNKIRFAPPLVITEEQIHDCLAIIKSFNFG